MRSRGRLLTIAAGLGVLALGAARASSAPADVLALLAAAVLATEIFEAPEEGAGADPLDGEPLRVVSGVHLAACVALGAWPAALLAGSGALGARRFRGLPWRTVLFQAGALALAAAAGGLAFRFAGGHPG